MKLLVVAGARPNFVKIAPILKVLRQYPQEMQPRFVHTGQHYDARMSQAFLDDLGIGMPDIALGVGSGSHAVQTARVMEAFEQVVLQEQPDRIMVVGDVNSTMACTLVGAKLNVPVDHVEAGLRSFDRRMPEEINRIVTDALSDHLFIHSPEARDHLLREGVAADRIHFVGNVMIDCLVQCRERIDRSTILRDLGLPSKGYALLTMHRPANVDAAGPLKALIDAVVAIGHRIRVVFSVHPRTQKMIEQYGLSGLLRQTPGLLHIEPQPYFDFIHLQQHARLVLTDSGGVQEETTFLGVPCLTLRENTERPVTVSQGTSRLVGTDGEAIRRETDRILRGAWPAGSVPALWDGHAAERIVAVLRNG
jgi:UDP-N-acetylglucosamine 2-epimerase (non-hydrolysing)